MSDLATTEQHKDYLENVKKEIYSLLPAYVLADNGWLEAAFANDKALAKYGNPENLRDAIKQNPENVELVYYPGLVAMVAHERANELYKLAQEEKKDSPEALAYYAYARRISQAAASISGTDIHPGAEISSLFIDHALDVVVGETAIIGKPPKIEIDENGVAKKIYGKPGFLLHGVTLGNGSTEKDGRRHPQLGDGVEIYSHSHVYGACYLGDNLLVKAGATIRDSDFADCEVDKRTEVGTGAEITNCNEARKKGIGKNVKIYANAIIFDSNIGDDVKIRDGAKVSKSEISNGATINADAKITNCVIGEGAIIGAGVELDGVTVPPYAEIQKIAQPLAIIYSPEHQGVVRPIEMKVEESKSKKPAKVSVFAEIENTDNWQDKLGAYAAQKASELEVALR